MILGIGLDITEVTRIEQVLERYGARFLDRIFTIEEKAAAAGHLKPASFLAKRFAAKEACAKAFGTGFSDGLSWTEIGVVTGINGRPELVLTGKAMERLQLLTPKGMQCRCDISLSDEKNMAAAMVVISAF